MNDRSPSLVKRRIPPGFLVLLVLAFSCGDPVYAQAPTAPIFYELPFFQHGLTPDNQWEAEAQYEVWTPVDLTASLVDPTEALIMSIPLYEPTFVRLRSVIPGIEGEPDRVGPWSTPIAVPEPSRESSMLAALGAVWVLVRLRRWLENVQPKET